MRLGLEDFLAIVVCLLRGIWKITGGNAEVFENAGLKEKAIRKLLKTKGRFCTKQRVIRDVKMGSLWCVEMEIIARVPPVRSRRPEIGRKS